MIKLIGNQN